MRLGRFVGLGVAAALAASLALAGGAQAAFPGRDGLLAVQPLKRQGIVLVNAQGHGERRVCAMPATGARACSLVRPQWSPDGQTLTVGSAGSAGPVSVIYPDGSCLVCQVAFAFSGFAGLVDPAFTSNPTLLTAVVPRVPGSPGVLYEYGVDGLQKGQALASGPLSDPVWSSRGKLALVRGGWIWVGNPHNLHRLARGRDPSWSPDGSRIVFDREGWLLVRRLRARMARRLARGTAPAWSPDGKSIAFIGPHHRLSVVRARGGRVRFIGDVTGRTVDWQPLPATAPAACLTPPGSTVMASSDTAIVSVDTLAFSYAEAFAAMGCLRADGRERVLTFEAGGRGYDYVSRVVVAGTLAAVETTNSYTSCPSGITVYDLQTGKGSDYYGGAPCPFGGSPPAAGIDPLLLNANGFAAWLVTQSDETQQLYAHNSQGSVIVDSAPAGSSAAIGNVQLTGDQLTWTHSGTPHELTLQ